MGYQLRIGDGTSYVTLTDGVTAGPLAYTPKTPKFNTQYTDAPGTDGADLIYAAYANVAESMRVVLLGSVSTIRANVQALHRFFQQARLYQAGHRGGALVPVYVEFLPDGDATWYRSPLFNGSIELDDDALDYQWLAGQVEATVAWERAFYWEGQPVNVPLANMHGGPTTAFLRVWGGDDAGHDNFTDIDAAAVGGDLPSPARLEVRSADSTAAKVTDLYVGHAVWLSPPSSFTHQYDSNLTCSWSGTAEATLTSWDLYSGQLNLATGGYFKVLLTLSSRPGATYSDLRLRVRLRAQGRSEVLHEGGSVLYDGVSTQIDLGPVRLPPSWTGDTPSTAFGTTVELLGTRASGAATSLQVACASFIPTDSFRHYAPIANASLSYLDRLVDDGPNRALYWRNNSGYSLVTYQSYGRPLMLWPNRTQRLYFLVDTDLGNVNPTGRQLDVAVSFRPRRLHL